MSKDRFIAYFRVSTARQGRSGLGLDAQHDSVETYLKTVSGNLIETFVEVESGSKDGRPNLEAALAMCRVHNATLIIAKLDRLARNVEFIARLMNSRVEFIATDMPEANKLTVHIMAAMAEHEREMISTRTKAALAQAKARGVKLGGDRGNIHLHSKSGASKSAAVRAATANDRALGLLPLVRDAVGSGASSLSLVAKTLNHRSVKTARGGKWSRAQVKALIDRINKLVENKVILHKDRN